MVKLKHYDFAKYEPVYPKLFRALRRSGWRPDRRVDYPDADDLDPRKGRGRLILLDYAEDFLHSFYGLEVISRGPAGRKESLSVFLGKNWEHLDYDEDYLIHVGMFAADTGIGEFAYPVLEFSSFVGFVTDEGGAFAIDHSYQRYARAEDIFQIMEWGLWMRKSGAESGVESGYLDWKYVPKTGFEHLYWDRPLEYYPTLYRAYALREGDQTDYVLEYTQVPKILGIRVTDLTESGSDLFGTYTKYPLMPEDIACNIILVKLLDEFFEGTYRQRIERIHLKSKQTGEVTTMVWPTRQAMP